MSYFGSIYADQELSHRARTVYMYLKDRSDAGNTCWPSVRRIAEDLKLSRRTVQRALTDLERHGFLERTHRRRPNGSLTSKGSVTMAHPEGLTLSEVLRQRKE